MMWGRSVERRTTAQQHATKSVPSCPRGWWRPGPTEHCRRAGLGGLVQETIHSAQACQDCAWQKRRRGTKQGENRRASTVACRGCRDCRDSGRACRGNSGLCLRIDSVCGLWRPRVVWLDWLDWLRRPVFKVRASRSGTPSGFDLPCTLGGIDYCLARHARSLGHYPTNHHIAVTKRNITHRIAASLWHRIPSSHYRTPENRKEALHSVFQLSTCSWTY